MSETVYTKEKLNELSSVKKLSEFLIQEFKQIDLKTAESRQEFLKFCAGFKSFSYSFKNSIMLWRQAEQTGVLPVFGTYNEWREKCNVSVRRGEKAMIICVPRTIEGYIIKEENGEEHFVRKAYLNVDEQQVYDEKVSRGEAKSATILKFAYTPCIFSLSQTTMQEQDRVAYLQRYNAYNTEEQNTAVYAKLRAVAQGLNMEIVEQPIQNEALGWVNYKNDMIVVKADMPVNAKCATYIHEIGHKLLHESVYKGEKNLSHEAREIQAELTSRLIMEKVGIDSETEFQNRYIRDYLMSAAARELRTHKESNLDSIQSEVLYKHLNEVMPTVKILGDILNQDVVGRQSIEKLRAFAAQPSINAVKPPMAME